MAKKPNTNDILNEQGFILGNDEDIPKKAKSITPKLEGKVDVKALKNINPVKVDVQQTVKENVTTVVMGDAEQPAQLTIKEEKNEPAAEEIQRENYTELEIQFVSLSIQYTNNNTKAYIDSYGKAGYSIERAQQHASDLLRSDRLRKLREFIQSRVLRQTERNLLWSFEDSVNALKRLVLTAQEEMTECKNDGQIKNQLNMPRVMAIRDAVKEINLMMGYTDKTTKINNTVVIKGSEADLPD